MTVFEGKSLGIAVGKIFDRLADNNSLGEDGGILISVRKSGAEVKASPEKIVKELQKQTESELQKKESRATVYVFESEEDTKTREIAEKYGITVTKAEFLKHLFSENPGITIGKQEELAGYSSKRLIREINEQEYQISLKPVVVKTTFEKASEETTEESTPEETQISQPSPSSWISTILSRYPAEHGIFFSRSATSYSPQKCIGKICFTSTSFTKSSIPK